MEEWIKENLEGTELYSIIRDKFGTRITREELYGLREKVNLDLRGDEFVLHMDHDILPLVWGPRLETIKESCRQILRTNGPTHPSSFLKPGGNPKLRSCPEGTPFQFVVPTIMMPKIESELEYILGDVRTAVGCRCYGGIGAEDCTLRCSTEGIARLYPDAGIEWDQSLWGAIDVANDDYWLVKPYIEIDEKNTTATVTSFWLRCYTDTQLAGFAYRVRNILINDGEYTYEHYRVIRNTPDTRNGGKDYRGFFFRLDSPDAGMIPPCVPTVSARFSRFLVGRGNATLEKIRAQTGISSLNLMVIPGNIHRLNVFTSREAISKEQLDKLMGTISHYHSQFDRPKSKPASSEW